LVPIELADSNINGSSAMPMLLAALATFLKALRLDEGKEYAAYGVGSFSDARGLPELKQAGQRGKHRPLLLIFEPGNSNGMSYVNDKNYLETFAGPEDEDDNNYRHLLGIACPKNETRGLM
jgi:hypothetical protein